MRKLTARQKAIMDRAQFAIKKAAALYVRAERAETQAERDRLNGEGCAMQSIAYDCWIEAGRLYGRGFGDPSLAMYCFGGLPIKDQVEREMKRRRLQSAA